MDASQDTAKPKVLVTGASGLIGRLTIEQLGHKYDFSGLSRRAVAGIPRAFRTAFWRDGAQREQSLFCHRQIVHALERRQARLAEAVMRMHIVGAIEFLAEVIDDE